MKIFVGYGYNDRDKWIEEHVFDLIRAFGVEPISGKEIYGEQLEDGVRRQIRECDAFLGFTTRRDKLQDGRYTTHRWVTDEIIAGTTLVHDGTIVHKPTLDVLAKGSA